jgi:hypothetical protein
MNKKSTVHDKSHKVAAREAVNLLYFHTTIESQMLFTYADIVSYNNSIRMVLILNVGNVTWVGGSETFTSVLKVLERD